MPHKEYCDADVIEKYNLLIVEMQVEINKTNSEKRKNDLARGIARLKRKIRIEERLASVKK